MIRFWDFLVEMFGIGTWRQCTALKPYQDYSGGDYCQRHIGHWGQHRTSEGVYFDAAVDKRGA